MTVFRLAAVAASLFSSAALAQPAATFNLAGLELPRAAPLGLTEPNLIGGLVAGTLQALPELPGLGQLASVVPRLDAFQPLPLSTAPLSELTDTVLAPLPDLVP
jgi:hypothetical protein